MYEGIVSFDNHNERMTARAEQSGGSE
jgi:hypothetical protein